MPIIIPTGGHVINDATALPSDVVSGKIFYNNNGVQTGTLPLSSYTKVKEMTIKIPSISDYNKMRYETLSPKKYNIMFAPVSNMYFQTEYNITRQYKETIQYASKTKIPYNTITSIICGEYVMPVAISIDNTTCTFEWYQDSGYYDILIYNGYLYCYVLSNRIDYLPNRSITIRYI